MSQMTRKMARGIQRSDNAASAAHRPNLLVRVVDELKLLLVRLAQLRIVLLGVVQQCVCVFRLNPMTISLAFPFDKPTGLLRRSDPAARSPPA